MKKLRLLLIVALLGLSGCATADHNWSIAKPGTWPIFSHGKSLQAVAKVTALGDKQEDAAVKAAQVEVVKTGVALVAAQVEHPDSLPVTVAVRTNANAAALLNQREPLSAASHEEAVKTAQGLLVRAESAERAQASVEKANRVLSKDLDSTRTKLKKLDADRDAEARKNVDLANELSNERIIKWAGISLSTIFGIAAFAYKLNLGNFQAGAADLLATLRAKHGDAVADTATNALDAALTRAQQTGVAQALFSLTKK